MATVSVRIDEELIVAARSAAKAEFRTLQGQIEFWAKLGRAALDNPSALWTRSDVPRWLSLMAWATALGLFFLSFEMFGLNLSAFIAPISVLYLVWMVSFGVYLIRRARSV